jgi:hypothetical protein
MGCNCGRKRSAPLALNILDGYANLKPHQIKSRLEVFKKNYCKNCEKRYKCDYNSYQKCTIRPRGK